MNNGVGVATRAKVSYGGEKEKKPKFAHLYYNIRDKESSKFKKSFIGVVKNVGMTYNIQEAFNIEGYFRVKVTPLRANLCLLEENEEVQIEALASEAKD